MNSSIASYTPPIVVVVLPAPFIDNPSEVDEQRNGATDLAGGGSSRRMGGESVKAPTEPRSRLSSSNASNPAAKDHLPKPIDIIVDRLIREKDLLVDWLN